MAGAQLHGDASPQEQELHDEHRSGALRPTAGASEAAGPAAKLTRSLVRRLAGTGGDLLVYGALRAAWGLLRGLSPEHSRQVLESIGGWVGRVDRHHRRVVASNLALAFPDWDEPRRSRAVDVSFRNWGRLAAEIIHAQALMDSAPRAPWQQAAAAAAAAAAAGRGLLVLTAHTGNFELLARTWSLRIGPLAVFHRNLGNAYVDGFLRSQRGAVRMTTLGRGEPVRAALRLLADGTSLAVALDQNQRPGHGVFVDMFGRAACTSTMLARLSLAAGAPVLPVFATWQGEATIPLVATPILPPPTRLGGEAKTRAIVSLTQRYTAEIEAAVRSHPEQWNWAHRRWKTRPQLHADDAASTRA